MASVTKPLALFRKSEPSKPLHARWGDVAISVPTEGSWNQYDNPHRPAKERQPYGPGFIPDISPSGQSTNPLREEELEEDKKSVSSERSSGSRRNSLSLGALRPGRLSVRLASRPKNLRGETPTERENLRSEKRRAEFAYKPIHQDYPAEVNETSNQTTTRFRYIPTNGSYLEDIPSPRSQSAQSFREPRSRRDSFSDPFERDRGRESPISRASERGYHVEDDRHNLQSSVADGNDSPGPRLSIGLPPRRRPSPFVSADRKRSSSLKPMTMTMVPDPEELYE
ncbi:hypothetical protein N7532_009319 [Penicillium argentinense]|uniref:Uncharacterized protein n=1 Tax=Penicillium argentinense TaxID=1131581 RepID=A0A9W9EZ75_9EURO|nr:uncharacterized protein N7532_009319 [Penicillium argentinense]KAJ5090635.1 hypothetical protein N7532_009319 [Penicillium argentinense]